ALRLVPELDRLAELTTGPTSGGEIADAAAHVERRPRLPRQLDALGELAEAPLVVHGGAGGTDVDERRSTDVVETESLCHREPLLADLDRFGLLVREHEHP